MEKIAFIGGYDKTDMLFYVAKLLRTMGHKVLVVDTTVSQKARFIIPNIAPTMNYITSCDSVDFAIGFDSLDKLKAYMLSEEAEWDYEYMLIDIDSRAAYRNFELLPKDKHYVVTSFDIYSLKKAVNVLRGIEVKTSVTKVYFTKSLLEDEDRYFRFLTKDCSIAFKKEPILFPTDVNDIEAIHKNQRDGILRYKTLSSKYLYGITYITEEISEESSGNIRKALKQIDR